VTTGSKERRFAQISPPRKSKMRISYWGDIFQGGAPNE
jgi:hypothetical protein